MADETYRKFHSGRFGPTGQVDIQFNTQIAGTDGVSGGESPSQKKPALGKDKEGNTYKNQAIADDFDAQNFLMKM